MEFTIKQFAAREQVHAQTVRRWIRKGALQVRHTPGGGIRVLAEAEASADARELFVLTVPAPRPR